MAGPCAVESEEQVEAVAAAVARSGAKILRGGAYKPRTSPYTFQGLGEEGLRILRRVADRHGLAVISEVLDTQHIPIMEKWVDVLQVGARNMQNFALLRELGRVRKPVLLKRGFSATIEEWLMSAEYILAGGNRQVMLLRARHPHVRDHAAQHARPLVRAGDPAALAPADRGRSRRTRSGIRDKVPPMACAAVAAGADGLLIEVHPHPETRFERRGAVALRAAVRGAGGPVAGRREGGRSRLSS